MTPDSPSSPSSAESSGGGYGQDPSAAPSPVWMPPTYEPSHSANGDQPAFGQPAYVPPVFEPANHAPYGQPTYGQAPYDQPTYPQPTYPQSTYPQATYPQAFGEPAPFSPGGYPPPPQMGQQWGQLAGKRSMDGLSIASLVFGIIGGILLAIPFGIAGLVRTRQGVRRGRPLAIAGLSLSLVWVIVLVGIITYEAGRQPDRAADGTVTHQGSISPANLRVGDCVKVPSFVPGQAKPVGTLTVTKCTDPHNGQVFTDVQSTDATYPGQSALTAEGLQDCSQPALTFLNKPSSTLELVVFVPTQAVWDTGNRTEHCILVDGAQDITDDIRNH